MPSYHDPWSQPGRGPVRGAGRDWHAGRDRIYTVAVGLLVALGVYTIVAGDQGILPQRALARKEAVLKEEIRAVDRRLQVLERDWEELQRTREWRARIDYNMVRPNEIIYEIGPADSVAGPISRVGRVSGESRP